MDGISTWRKSLVIMNLRWRPVLLVARGDGCGRAPCITASPLAAATGIPGCLLRAEARPACLSQPERTLPIASAKSRKVEQDFSGSMGNEFDQSNSKEVDLEDSETMLLLVQLVRSFLRKTSARATKAARGMLPPAFAPDLIAFFVNGALLLTLLWVAKALLEVVSCMGSIIFLGILLVRSIWSLIAYLQLQRTEDTEWNPVKPGDERYSPSPS